MEHFNFLTNTWINASAGSGKTTLIVNRILYLMLISSNKPKILCITFTNTAVNEMISRIIDKLKSWMFLPDHDLKKEIKFIFKVVECAHDVDDFLLKKARSLFLDKYMANVSVKTIHGFCSTILKNFAIEIGINPMFTIIDPNESSALFESAFKSLCLKMIDLNASIYKYNKKLIKDCIDAIMREVDECDINVFLKKLLMNTRSLFHVEHVEYKEFYSDNDMQCFVNHLWCNFYNESNAKNFSSTSRFFVLNNDIIKSWVNSKNKALDFEKYTNLFLTKAKEKRARFCDKNDTCYDVLLIEQDQIYNTVCLIENIKDYFKAHNMLSICALIIKKINSIKANRSLVEYNDLLLYLYRVFNNAEISDFLLYNIFEEVDHLFIDEAQDNSYLQWLIIKKIAMELLINKNKTIFIVGDIKQSIYGFQGANPDLFLENMCFFDYFAKNNERDFSIKESHFCYRCDNSIIGLINLILLDQSMLKAIARSEIPLEQISLTKKSGGVFLYSVAKYFDKKKFSVPWELKRNKSNVCAVANDVAKRIKDWHNAGYKISDTEKIFNFSDAMILVRKRDEFFLHLIDALDSFGVPYKQDANLKLNQCIIIQDFLVLVKFCLNCSDKTSLCLLFRSLFFGYKDSDILRFKLNNFDISRTFPKDVFILNTFKVASTELVAFDFFCKIFFEYGFIDNVYNKFGQYGSFIVDQWFSFLFFLEKKHSIKTLQHVVDFCDTQNIDFPGFVSENENKVLLSTIHAAKGKESSIVILPNANAYHGKIDQFTLFNNALFFNASFSKTLNDLKESIKFRVEDEELRLLYVAITRAKHELHVYGSEDDKNSWYSIIKSKLNTHAIKID